MISSRTLAVEDGIKFLQTKGALKEAFCFPAPLQHFNITVHSHYWNCWLESDGNFSTFIFTNKMSVGVKQFTGNEMEMEIYKSKFLWKCYYPHWENHTFLEDVCSTSRLWVDWLQKLLVYPHLEWNALNRGYSDISVVAQCPQNRYSLKLSFLCDAPQHWHKYVDLHEAWLRITGKRRNLVRKASKKKSHQRWIWKRCLSAKKGKYFT